MKWRLTVVAGALSALALFASPAVAAPITVADSVAEFSGTQGDQGWFYGYYASPGSPASFTLLPSFFGTTLWAEHVPSSQPWTLLTASGGHPNGPNSGSEHWAVRRWVSDVSGAVEISGNLAKENINGGGFGADDGIVGLIFVNGTEFFSQWISGGDATGINYSVAATLALGTTVDFAIDPTPNGGNDYYDLTRFTASITQASVPEPGTLALLALGLAGLRVRRRRNASQ